MGLDPDRLRSDLPGVRFLRARSSVFLCYIALITDASALRSRWHDGIRCHELPRSWCGLARGLRSIADALLDGYPVFGGTYGAGAVRVFPSCTSLRIVLQRHVGMPCQPK